MLWTEHFILLCVTSLTYMYLVTIFLCSSLFSHLITLFGCDHVLHLVGFTTQFRSVTSFFPSVKIVIDTSLSIEVVDRLAIIVHPHNISICRYATSIHIEVLDIHFYIQ